MGVPNTYDCRERLGCSVRSGHCESADESNLTETLSIVCLEDEPHTLILLKPLLVYIPGPPAALPARLADKAKGGWTSRRTGFIMPSL
jgi:hypothetical protein